MDRVEAFNQILSYLGEEPISTISTSDYTCNLINSSFEVVKRRILAQGFSFNTDKITLTADVNSKIAIPTNFLKPPRFQYNNTTFTVRNGYVWDNENAVYVGATPITSVVVLATIDIAYEQMPNVFQDWIALEIAQTVRISMNGIDDVVRFLESRKREAKVVALNSEPANSSLATGFSAIQAAYNQ